MQVVPGPLQSGAYPSIHHGTPGAAFPEASSSGSTARYASHILSRMETSGCILTCTGSSALQIYLVALPLPENLSCDCFAGLRMQRSRMQVTGLQRLCIPSKPQPLKVSTHFPPPCRQTKVQNLQAS